MQHLHKNLKGKEEENVVSTTLLEVNTLIQATKDQEHDVGKDPTVSLAKPLLGIQAVWHGPFLNRIT
jgi:hypothetical protein